jgi:hypothetical protein
MNFIRKYLETARDVVDTSKGRVWLHTPVTTYTGLGGGLKLTVGGISF